MYSCDQKIYRIVGREENSIKTTLLQRYSRGERHMENVGFVTEMGTCVGVGYIWTPSNL